MIEIGKVKISKEKLMKNEEMIALKGGVNCWCFYPNGNICGGGTAPDPEACTAMCMAAGCAINPAE